MSSQNQRNRTERCRYLANECRRLAANDPYTESRSFHLQMAELYSTLAEAGELKTAKTREPHGFIEFSVAEPGKMKNGYSNTLEYCQHHRALRQVPPNGWRLTRAAYH